MKKFLSITTAILVLLFVSFWGYMQYQRHISYQTLIPANTRVLIRVDVFDIYKSMLGEYFNRKKGRIESPLEGISIPANIFLFTLKDKQPTTLFTTLPIDNLDTFRRHLSSWDTLGQTIKATPDITIFTNNARTLTIAFTATRAAFAYAAGKEQVQQALIDLLQQKNTVAVRNSAFRDIQKQDGHITQLSGENKGSLDFNSGNIALQMDLSVEGLAVPAEVNHRGSQQQDILNLWLYADLKPFLAQQTFGIDTFRINGDSLLASQPKGFTFSIGPPQAQIDTVVTYEYNDDFEKVPTASVKETMAPGIVLNVDANAMSLYRYLQQQHCIGADGEVNRSLFPLYQLYAHTSSDQLQLSTSKNTSPVTGRITSGNFFHLFIDFTRLEGQKAFALIPAYTRRFQQLEAKAIKSTQQQCRLEVKLYFKDRQKHALLQLLDGI